MKNLAVAARNLATPDIPSDWLSWSAFAMANPEATNRVEELRTARGWSRALLAEKIGCGEQHVWRLEKGKRPLSEKWLIRLSRAFGVRPAEILAGGGLRDADFDYDDDTPLPADAPQEPQLEYDDADFMADIQLGLRKIYRDEKIEIGEGELIRAAFEAWRDLTPLGQGRKARATLLEAHLRAQRQVLRRWRQADLLGAKRPA